MFNIKKYLSFFFLFLGLFALCFLVYQKIMEKKKIDPKYHIQTIIQKGPWKEALPTAFFEELLDLSSDNPVNLYLFDCKKAEEKLLHHPWIEKVRLKKIYPNILFIDYMISYPLARVADFHHAVLTENGQLLPEYDCLAFSSLPNVYLGLDSFPGWKMMKLDRTLTLAIECIRLFNHPKLKPLKPVFLDFSNALSSHYGKRELVIYLEEMIQLNKIFTFPVYLRLNIHNYKEQLSNYLVLRKKILNDYKKQLISFKSEGDFKFKPKIIDMRIEKFAFVEEKA